MRRSLSWPASALLAWTIGAACGGAPPAQVTITSPGAGDTITGTAVHVSVDVSGVEFAPAAERRAGAAHLHLYLDTVPGALDAPIPLGDPRIVHVGQTSYHWDSVPPGEHRIIALLGDNDHVPLRPPAADTVRFVVRAP